MALYHNPIIRGFYPDPSVCRVGSDYYLVTSSFEFFPGVPLFHSTNLANWELIGHCLTSADQLSIRSCGHSLGIYAPTIRYHDGTFFMTTTDSSGIRNFIVYTDDLKKGWSAPVRVDQGGIDPSLFFDADGKVYYTSNGYSKDGHDFIQMCQIDPFTGEKLTPSRIISHGCGGSYPEGPHIYKRGGYYYLLLAEGGTEYGHHATIQRSRDIWGPYTPSPYNPLMSHRDLLGKLPIQAVGHADLLEDVNGNWWTVCHGVRPLSYGLLHNLGREPLLAPVRWTEDGWPVLLHGEHIALEMEGPLPAPEQPRRTRFYDNFSSESLFPDWTFIRSPQPGLWSLTEKPGTLCLHGDAPLSSESISPAFLGVRQEEHCISASTHLSCPLQDGQRAGLAAYYTCNYHYEIYLKRCGSDYFVAVNRRVHDFEAEVFCQKIEYTGGITLRIDADEKEYYFRYALPGGCVEDAASGAVAGLCTEGTANMTFTGVFIGLFSTGGSAAFQDFELKNV